MKIDFTLNLVSFNAVRRKKTDIEREIERGIEEGIEHEIEKGINEQIEKEIDRQIDEDLTRQLESVSNDIKNLNQYQKIHHFLISLEFWEENPDFRKSE
jgi:uncharacterized protein YllA (UPF0747 family)